MKILLAIPSLSGGGAARVLCLLANYWSKKGHQIFLLTLDSSIVVPCYHLEPTIKVCPLDLFVTTKENYLIRLILVINRILTIRKAFKTIKPDFILSFIYIMNLITLLSAFGLKVPVIVSERTDPKHHQIPGLHTLLRSIIYFLAKKIIVQTNAAKSFFSKALQKKIVIIANPVEEQKMMATIYPSVKKIISVGRLEKEKDHQTIILAFKKINQLFPDLSLSIIGEGPERKNLEKLLNHHNLQEKVFLPGAVKDVFIQLKEADIFVFASHFEGFPNALCEAMSVGLPVITSSCSGNVDIVRDQIDGRLFEPGEVNQLVALMQELMLDFELRKKLSQNALTISKRFNANEIFSCWDALICS